MNMKKPSMILIMDGYGISHTDYGNAIKIANTPGLDNIFAKYHGTEIDASGEAVGLPSGQMGNSEVGHMNIGAGRIVYQSLSRISMAISSGEFFDNDAFRKAVDHVIDNDSCLHITGLLSDGGVHSHLDHIKALIDLACARGVKRFFIHCYLDGRDVPPRSALTYIKSLEEKLKGTNGRIATISGRYYSMDRDKRWDREQKAYDAMTLGPTASDEENVFTASTCELALKNAYDRGENDEFVKPTFITGGDESKAADGTISDGDSVIMANFRPDRAREITRAFCDPSFDGFEQKVVPKDLVYVSMTEYDKTIPGVLVAYPPEDIVNTLGSYVSGLGLTQLRIAETEKYAHVTFFFNGGVEDPDPREDRILIPSPKVATYDMKPEMSAYEVTESVLSEIKKDKYDLIVLNFANADMVGHTGVMDAAVKAIEALDRCVPRIVDEVLDKGGQVLLTADHGNADVMLDSKGNAVTSHSLNKVPLYHIARNSRQLKEGGKLADIAPTMLALMGLDIPPEMTGDVLVK